MSRDTIIKIASGVLLLLGLATLLLPLVFSSARIELSSATAQALLLSASGWLLYKRHKLAIVTLAVAAVFYLVGGWYTAQVHGIPMSALIPAFYWSLAVRVLAVFFVSYLLSGTTVLTHHSSGTR